MCNYRLGKNGWEMLSVTCICEDMFISHVLQSVMLIIISKKYMGNNNKMKNKSLFWTCVVSNNNDVAVDEMHV